MNILFLTLIDFNSIHEQNIYTDLLREFIVRGDKIFIISPTEKNKKIKTHLIIESDSTILKLQIGNMQKNNIIEKGLSTILLEPKLIKGIKKYFSNVTFDLILYSTPPITLQRTVEFVKQRDSAKTYLLLKDIFPQNAVDLGMLTKKGVRGIVYKYFREKEISLYKASDYIGCMSPANVEYILSRNPFLNKQKVEVCPNCRAPRNYSSVNLTEEAVRCKYNLPLDAVVFLYGGNLGKPQGVDFLLQCLEANIYKRNSFFLIVGNGTEFEKIKAFINIKKPKNIKLIKTLNKEDYEELVRACDVGMIFLDIRFTIPNFPSRVLSYLDAGLPVLAVTDEASDVGKILETAGAGIWCKSDSVKMFCEKIKFFERQDIRQKMGKNAKKLLYDQYTTQKAYETIWQHLE